MVNNLSIKLKRKINRYLRKLFSSAFEDTLEVKELKEELKSYIITEVSDLVESGKSEEKAFEIAKNNIGNNSDFEEGISGIFNNTKYLFILKSSYVCMIIYIIIQLLVRLKIIGIIDISHYNLRIMSKFSFIVFIIGTIIFFIWTFMNFIFTSRTFKFKIQAIVINILNIFISMLWVMASKGIVNVFRVEKSFYIALFLDMILYFTVYSKKVFKFK
ncbi:MULTISPECIES: permease prefix domain 1-containing protein [unclassified Clostridium]|uniref:permease prefix domain 1-containing protein n=1 Tax=unclassified Clostridium TaxID=2614128 RepID=UPI003216CF73